MDIKTFKSINISPVTEYASGTRVTWMNTACAIKHKMQ